MNKLLLLLYIMFSLNCFSQAKKIKIKKEKQKAEKYKAPLTSLASIDAYYGNIVFKDKFYSQLNTGDSLKFNLPPNFVGLGISGISRQIGPTYFVFQFDFQKYIPHPLILEDSIHATFSGGSFGLGIGKCFASSSGNLSIIYYLGFNSGRCTLSNSENISLQKQFFCPKISLQPKLMIKRLAISIIISAQGDITSAKWLPTYTDKKNKVLINGLYQTGFIGLVSLGYRINI
ncbi:MAG: hypothetical protein IPL10_09600 [Bacteroidetes bacterium]|jgi:hypothetical protein|nr:hypothetical protein [Bacteroidota bacterium]